MKTPKRSEQEGWERYASPDFVTAIDSVQKEKRSIVHGVKTIRFLSDDPVK